ncbi:hypothetical protein JR316_0007762 [Psilocybe cubensis]|uniref:Uncharacterized protein n=2 Tax=Psilocybe cubensis TaxID=181762 RepID=A0A8H8CIP0_PSICU|nr:hypothetical protein JR316_0007762 [Psilocybe cubensis]KAH9479176.1 hypothetical protein JR316_0007762 [Psilocybe cubensis]
MSGSARQVIVDDNDSTIVYSPNWSSQFAADKDNQGNFGKTLRSTLHGTNSNGTFQFQFSGTQIEVFGSLNMKNTSGILDPTWDCQINTTSIGATAPFLFPENNWSLCSADNLPTGTHTLTLTTQSHRRTFLFDYIQYTPSNPNDLNDALVKVPPTDPEIVYDSSWSNLANIANITRTKGSTMTFNFTGISATWYGIVPSELPPTSSQGTYAIDGNPAMPFVLAGLSPNSVTEYNQIFIQTPQLSPGPHTMTVTYEGDTESTPLTLQYILVQNVTEGSKSITSSASASSETSSNVSLSAMNDKKQNVAGIVSGVLAVVIVICLSAFIYLKYIRDRRKGAGTPRWENIVKPFSISRAPRRVVESASMSTIGLFGPSDDTTRPNHPRPTSGFTIPTRTRPRSFLREPTVPPPLPDLPQVQSTPQPKPKLKPIQTTFNNPEQPQASGSRPPRRPKKKKEPPKVAVNDLDENTSYYGGYQTWGQTKALEAASGARARDSYI